MSWILWVLISIVGVIIYVNIGHVVNWAGNKEVDSRNLLAILFFPLPESFGVKGVLFGKEEEDSDQHHRSEWIWVLFWPFWLVFSWVLCLLDWVLVLFRTLGRGIKALPKSKAFDVLFKGGWLK